MNNDLLIRCLQEEDYKRANTLAGSGSGKGRTKLETFILQNIWEYLNGDNLFRRVIYKKIFPSILILCLIKIVGDILGIKDGFIVAIAVFYMSIILSFFEVANLLVRLSVIYFSWITLLPLLPQKPLTKRYQNTARFMVALILMSAAWGIRPQ